MPSFASDDAAQREAGEALVTSVDPNHPANLIPSLCAKFWTLGWVTGTGGGCSIRDEYVFFSSFFSSLFSGDVITPRCRILPLCPSYILYIHEGLYLYTIQAIDLHISTSQPSLPFIPPNAMKATHFIFARVSPRTLHGTGAVN
ncbi:Methylthioribulose-1-phosphate dehydratase [Ilyonectria robusta]